MQSREFFRHLKKYYMEVIEPIGRVMSFIILTFLWLVVFGIYAIITKILRAIGIMKPAPTGWQDSPPEPPENVHYQF